MTLREHLEAIQDRHRHWANDLTHGHFCRRCGYPMPCPDYRDAVEALAILDESKRAVTWFNDVPVDHLRLVNDPEPSA